MAGQLIPPPELAPEARPGQTPEQRLQQWRDLMDTCEQFLLAGLRHKIGPDGDLTAAYRAWYRARMEQHDQTMVRISEELGRRLGSDGR